MQFRKPLVAAVISFGGLLAVSASFAADLKPTPAGGPAVEVPRVQMAILLDTSGSMEGLINQARTQLWKIVNELATVQRDGKTPEMNVALYEYGKSSLSASEGYLRMIVPLTDDLDKVSNELFALKTNGGEEYCGHVIDAATKGLKWSDSPNDLKLIFIAGNEPFTQGTVDYRSACANAIGKGITINTIFCGPTQEGIRTGWQDGAKLADGSFLSIDQNRQVATVETPYDKQLSQLSSAVNKTYVYFGAKDDRKRAASSQLAADAAASKAAPAAEAERAQFKGSSQYRVSGKDLVEAVKNKKLRLEEVDEKELPQELQKLSVEERKAYVEKQSTERESLQKQIRELSQKRQDFIAEQEKKNGDKGKATLDSAIIKTIREQAEKKNFEQSK